MLKSAAYIRASAGGVVRTCDILRASLPTNMPWIRNILLVGGDGRVQCSTNNTFVGLYLGDRPYIKKARATRDFVFSDFLWRGAATMPVIMAAYPVSAINPDSDAVMLASISLDWMSKLMSNLGGRPGISAVLVDSNGTVLATPPDTASQVGKSHRRHSAAVGDGRQRAQLEQGRGIAHLRRRRRLAGARSAMPALPAPARACWSASTRTRSPPRSRATSAPPICSSPSSVSLFFLARSSPPKS